MNWAFGLTVLIGMGAAGCTFPSGNHFRGPIENQNTIETSVIMTGRRRSPYHGEVTVLKEGEPVPASIDEIAVIQAVGGMEEADSEVVLSSLKLMAARLGCNTLIRTRLDEGFAFVSGTAVCVRTHAHGTLSTPATALKLDEPKPPSGDEETRDAGEDELILKNGETVRGTVVALEPDRHVVILDPKTRKSRKVSSHKVKDVVRGRYQPPPKLPPEEPKTATRALPCPEPSPAEVKVGVPRVHIETTDPDVQLNRWLLSSVPPQKGTAVLTNGHEFICKSPCDINVDGRMGQEFFFTGQGIADSSRFRLINRTGDVTIRVRPGVDGMHSFGMYLVYYGLATAGTGFGWLAWDELQNGSKLRTQSIGISVSGLVMTGVGPFLSQVIGKTEYSFYASGPRGGMRMHSARQENSR